MRCVWKSPTTARRKWPNSCCSNLTWNPDDLYRVNGPVNLVRLMGIPDMVARDDLKFPAFVPGVPAVLQKKGADMFKVIRKGDILLHHPFQSFKPVIDFIQQAATDPGVVAIKQTVYRTGVDSALMEALIAASAASARK